MTRDSVVSVERRSLGHPSVRALIDVQQREIAARYGGRFGSGAPPLEEEFEPPNGVFVVAVRDGELLGCGGVCKLEPGVGEIRRMYVVPGVRGTGLGRRLLGALEDEAVALGFTTIRLETGSEQHEAIGLYERSGYRRGPCWGAYVTDPRSRCYEKALPR
jgi:putative acetyltransferase